MQSPAPGRAAPPAGRRAPQRRTGVSRMLRVAVVGVPVVLFCLLAAVVGLRWWLGRFLQGDEFRQFLDRKTSAALRAESHFEPFHWQDSEVYSAGLDIRGSPGSPLKDLHAEQMRAVFNLRALWRRVWRVETVDIETATTALGPDGAWQDTSRQPAPGDVPLPASDAPPFLSPMLPRRVEVGLVRVTDLTLKWVAGQPAEAGSLEHVRLSARMLGDVWTWEVEGRGGTLLQARLPPISLDEFSVKTNAETIFVTRASGRPGPGGHLEFAGRQALTGGRELDATFDFEGVPVATFLPADWRGRLHGNTSGHAHIAGSPLDPQGWRVEGHLDLHEGRLEALPLLDQIALFTSTARYRQTVVQKGGADFTWTPDHLEVRDVVLESEGLLRLEGGFTVRDEQMDGRFRVGIAVSSLQWLNEISTLVFDQGQHDGYLWTTMRLTGPASNPHDDLTERLTASAAKAVEAKTRQGVDTVIDTAHDLLNLLHRK